MTHATDMAQARLLARAQAISVLQFSLLTLDALCNHEPSVADIERGRRALERIRKYLAEHRAALSPMLDDHEPVPADQEGLQ